MYIYKKKERDLHEFQVDLCKDHQYYGQNCNVPNYDI